MRKLIFCDIDGTILDGSRHMNEVSAKTRYAISELRKDDYVIISSGRCMGLLDGQIKALDPNGYILCNGAHAQVDNKEIYSMYFEPEAIEKIKETVIRYHGFYILETLNEMYVDSLVSDSFSAFVDGWGSSLQGFSLGKDKDEKYLIAMIGFMDRSIMKDVERELAPYVDLAAHKQFSSYDVNIKGVNKGTGVERIREYLNIPFEDTYCFGDGINDLEMLQSVAHPVVVANCVDELKKYGFEETDDVLDDGFYNYLLAHKLIKAI